MGTLAKEKPIKIRVGKDEIVIRVYQGDPDKPVLLLLHGATNDMNHPLVKGLAQLMAEKGWSTIRFNFRFVKERKKPDFAEVTREYMAVLRWIQSQFKDIPVYVAGKSLGAFVSIFNAKNAPIDGIIAFGYPTKRPDGSLIDQSHLRDIDTQILFIQGTADPYADKGFLENVIKEYRLNALSFWLDNVGHSLDGVESVAIQFAGKKLEEWVQRKRKD